MNHDRVWDFSPLALLFVSIVGLALVPVLVTQPRLDSFQFEGQRYLVGALFCAVCVCGVVAVFYPAKCRRVFQHTPNPTDNAISCSIYLRIEGHHPSCQNFLGNRIAFVGRVFCAACSGLLVGAAIALVGAVAYFFGGLNAGWGDIWLVALGEICMLLGLAQIKVAGFVKVMVNALFVVGSFVTLAAVDAMGKSLLLDLYVLGLIVFLLWFRIFLSELNNRRICCGCKLSFH
jgi:hypothetical protein